MVLFGVVLSPTLGLRAESPTQSTAQLPAYCHVTSAGLECYRQERHLPTDSSLVLQDSIFGRHTKSPGRCWPTQIGEGLARITCVMKSQSRVRYSALRTAQLTWISLRSLGAPRVSSTKVAQTVDAVSSQVNDGDGIFKDGFESGDLTSWSDSAPNILPVISEEGLPEDGGTTHGGEV